MLNSFNCINYFY